MYVYKYGRSVQRKYNARVVVTSETDREKYLIFLSAGFQFIILVHKYIYIYAVIIVVLQPSTA